LIKEKEGRMMDEYKIEIIAWDGDGTLFYDDGKYDHPKQNTPLVRLLDQLRRTNITNILITGSDHIESTITGWFDKIITRPFPVEPYNTYYSRYFQWKLDTILKEGVTMAFDDDQQICRACLMRGIPAFWLPQYSYIPKIMEGLL